MCLDDKYNLLPIIDISDDSIFYIDTSKEETKIKNLISKHIIYELCDKEEHGITVMSGKLLGYKDKRLLIKNDFGFNEEIILNDIRGIEEYISSEVEEIEQYINHICEITGRNGKVIKVLIVGYDEFEILFHYKYMKDNKEYIGESSIPAQLVTNIILINDEIKNKSSLKKKIIFPNGIKRVTSVVENIEGVITNICDIKPCQKSVIIEGKVCNIRIVDKKEMSVIFAKLTDNTGIINIVILDKDKSIEKIIKRDNLFQIYGDLNKQTVILVKQIKLVLNKV